MGRFEIIKKVYSSHWLGLDSVDYKAIDTHTNKIYAARYRMDRLVREDLGIETMAETDEFFLTALKEYVCEHKNVKENVLGIEMENSELYISKLYSCIDCGKTWHVSYNDRSLWRQKRMKSRDIWEVEPDMEQAGTINGKV